MSAPHVFRRLLDTASQGRGGQRDRSECIGAHVTTRPDTADLMRDLPWIPLRFTANSAAVAKGLAIETVHNPGGKPVLGQLKDV